MVFDKTDFIVLSIYIVGILLAVFLFSKRTHNLQQYFLANRSIPWFVIGCALFATDISSEHFLGVSGSGYKYGLASSNFVLSAVVVLVILGWFFTPFYLKTGVMTMPEFLEKRYNEHCRWFLSVISILAYVLTKVSVTLLAGGIVLMNVMGWDLYTSALVLVLFAGVYTIVGGSNGIIRVQFFQAIFLLFGSLLLVYFGLQEVGGFEALKMKVPEGHFKIFRPMDDPHFPWPGMVFGAFILGVWYWTTDQYIVQITLSAKNIDHARSGAIWGAWLRLLAIVILLVPGIIGKALYPNIDGSQVYITMVTELLPSGIRALVVISLLAALLSSLASSFNATATLFTVDIYNKIYPHANEFVLVNIGRIVTFVMVIMGVIWVPFINAISDDIYEYIQSVMAYIAPPICAVFIIGILWPRANGKAAFSVLIVGLFLGTFKFISDILYKTFHMKGRFWDFLAEVNFLHFAIFVFILSVVLMFVISLLTEAPTEDKVKGLTLKYANEVKLDEHYQTEYGKWKKWNLVFSILLFVVLIAYWVTFG